MAEIIRMPRLSDTMEEGNIVGWMVKVGDTVSPGDIMAEVETDKATMELESFQKGTILYIGVKEGPVPVDGIIAVIGEKGEDYKSLLAEAEKSSSSNGTNIAKEPEPEETKEAPISTTNKKESTSPVEAPPQESDTSDPQETGSPHRLKASPLAKSLAEEANITLQNVTGSGDQGRIVKRDVEAYLSSGATTRGPESQQNIATPKDFEYGIFPISQMRKVIAKRLGESKFNAPHFYLTVEINMDNLVKARSVINENAEVRISFNDLVIKASAAALRKHPAINSSWLGDSIAYHQDINIGVAVAVDEGLLVPVINNADQKGLNQINQEVRELAKKAKTKKLQPKEMQGNTFTISNLGMFDIEEFTAIINPPDACIMAVGSIIEKPIVKDGQIVVGNMMKITLSCDHRVVDGVTGSQFLQTFKGMLEEPVRIII